MALEFNGNSALPERTTSAASAFEFLEQRRAASTSDSGRDDNSLDWHAQDEAAAQSIGSETKGTSDPAYWMRTYYRHARTVYRRAILAMEALPPGAASLSIGRSGVSALPLRALTSWCRTAASIGLGRAADRPGRGSFASLPWWRRMATG